MSKEEVYKTKMQEIEKAISKGVLAEAVKLLEIFKDVDNAKYRENIVLIEKSWSDLLREITNGTIERQNKDIISNQIGSRILNLLKEIDFAKKNVIENENISILDSEKTRLISYIKFGNKILMQAPQLFYSGEDKPEPVFATLRYIEENLNYVVNVGEGCEEIHEKLGPLYLSNFREVSKDMFTFREMMKKVQDAKIKLSSIGYEIPVMEELDNCEKILAELPLELYNAAEEQRNYRHPRIVHLKQQVHSLNVELKEIQIFLRNEKLYLKKMVRK